jgi:hypothetical protein
MANYITRPYVALLFLVLAANALVILLYQLGKITEERFSNTQILVGFMSFAGSLGYLVLTDPDSALDFEFFEIFWVGLLMLLFSATVCFRDRSYWEMVAFVFFAYAFYIKMPGTESRYTLFIAGFLLIVTFLSIQRLAQRYRNSSLEPGVATLLALLVGVNLFTAPGNPLAQQDITTKLLNYQQNSETVFSCIPSGATVYTSFPETIYIESQNRNLDWSVRKTVDYYTFKTVTEDKQSDQFYIYGSSFNDDLSKLKSNRNLEEVCSFNINSVYRLGDRAELVEEVLILRSE